MQVHKKTLAVLVALTLGLQGCATMDDDGDDDSPLLDILGGALVATAAANGGNRTYMPPPQAYSPPPRVTAQAPAPAAPAPAPAPAPTPSSARPTASTGNARPPSTPVSPVVVAAADPPRQAVPARPAEPLVEFRESVTLCQLKGSQAQFGNWTCVGSLQMNYVNFKVAGWERELHMTCGGDRPMRDLGSASGYRAFGCGIGLPLGSPGDIPARFGVGYVPGRMTFRCRASAATCESR